MNINRQKPVSGINIGIFLYKNIYLAASTRSHKTIGDTQGRKKNQKKIFRGKKRIKSTCISANAEGKTEKEEA